MENDRENNLGQSGGQAQQNQDEGLFQGSDNASDELTSEQQSPGYGDQGAMGQGGGGTAQGGDQDMGGQGADSTGGTSVTGEEDAEFDDADIADVEDDAEGSTTPGSAI